MPSQEIDLPHLGHRRDAPDERDVAYAPREHLLASQPASVDLRRYCSPAYDQQKVRSCSAHALASHLRFIGNKDGSPIEPPSRLFIYYNERKVEGTQDSDSGSTLRTGIKVVAKQGTCAETLWPYDPVNVCVAPPPRCYDAANVRALSYARIEQRLDHLKACLADGFPFIFGMVVHESLIDAGKTGTMLMPAPDDAKRGDHAVMAAGYDDATQTLLVLNSVGANWGINGFFRMPYAYAADPKLTYDFWTIRTIS
jgi:C1A family cysteine protease